MPEKLLRLGAVMERVPYSRANIYRLIHLGQFPRQIPLGGRAIGWLESEIEAWIAQRVQNRTPQSMMTL
jgi:prophage regulatory protein